MGDTGTSMPLYVTGASRFFANRRTD